jgi:hypothetical protein
MGEGVPKGEAQLIRRNLRFDQASEYITDKDKLKILSWSRRLMTPVVDFVLAYQDCIDAEARESTMSSFYSNLNDILYPMLDEWSDGDEGRERTIKEAGEGYADTKMIILHDILIIVRSILIPESGGLQSETVQKISTMFDSSLEKISAVYLTLAKERLEELGITEDREAIANICAFGVEKFMLFFCFYTSSMGYVEPEFFGDCAKFIAENIQED